MGYLTSGPIHLEELVALVSSPEQGGIASFLGRVRNHHEGRAVERLEYSAYGPMVEAECARIVAETESRWRVAVALQHRIGVLAIGDTAVAVVAASAHRDEAFLACRHVIEELKRRVPIWKREIYADGTVEWVGVGGESGKRGSGEEKAPREPLELGARGQAAGKR